MHLAIIGYGAIGEALTGLLASDPVTTLIVLVRSKALAHTRDALSASQAAPRIAVTDSLSRLLDAKPDLAVECAGQGAVAELVPSLLRAGIPTIAASVGALADDGLAAALRSAAEAGATQLVLPAGAIGGIDLLAALAPAGGLEVTYRGTKPPAAWKGTPAEHALDLDALRAPAVFFSDTAREAARTYPKNANVAATLALAAGGFEATRVDLAADPDATGNHHAYEVNSPLGHFAMEIENRASGANAKTSAATVYSLLREINRRRHPVVS